MTGTCAPCQGAMGSGDRPLVSGRMRRNALCPRGAIMIKRIVLMVLTTALAMGVTVAPAQAGDQRRCVSQREYRDIRGYERQARVADHFDIPGTRIRYLNYGGGDVDTVWKYRKCSAWGPGGWYVGIWYDNYTGGDRYMRVWDKAPNRPYALGADVF